MFTDMTISADLNAKFTNYLKSSNATLGINFSLLILQVQYYFKFFFFFFCILDSCQTFYSNYGLIICILE